MTIGSLTREAGRPWGELSAAARNFFVERDRPLSPQHAARIRRLSAEDAARVRAWAFAAIPPGWPERAAHFRHEADRSVRDCWEDEAALARVRRWLSDRGIPFGREVFLLYDRDCVVRTDWKILVRYWDGFAWSVGYQMLAIDQTRQWAACFHHEEVIVFGSQLDPRPTRPEPTP